MIWLVLMRWQGSEDTRSATDAWVLEGGGDEEMTGGRQEAWKGGSEDAPGTVGSRCTVPA